jgi:hypothetical protein
VTVQAGYAVWIQLTGELNNESIEEVWQGIPQDKYRSAFINKEKDSLPDIC